MTASATARTASRADNVAPPPRGLPRLLASARDDGRPTLLAEHVGHYGELRAAARGPGLFPILSASGLAGRGGGAFPTAAKVRAVISQGGQPVVLANGVEGEPASGKDRALLRAVPHLVIDGAVLAAEAVGAQDVIVAVGRRATVEAEIVAAAIKERQRYRVDGRCSVNLVVAPDGFVNGEETALIQFLNGGPAKPTLAPPRPFERGVGKAPTLVQNVETLAHLALIARFGPRWFREVGTDDEPGSSLVSISGAVSRPGIHEIALGTSLEQVFDDAGGRAADVIAFLVGGYFGTWFPANAAPDLALTDAEVKRRGGGLGARVIVALPKTTCAVGEVARVARYMSEQSAGQCGPCVNGLHAIADALERLARGEADERKRLRRWVQMVNGRGACRHPDGATRFVASALSVFKHEVEVHLRYGRCNASTTGVLPVAKKARRA